MSAPRWLFTGDSITEWGRTDKADPFDIGENYVSLLAAERLPGTEVLNTGIGGDRLEDLQRRWQHDVLELAPDVLSVYIGINDTWRRYDHGIESPAERFGEVLTELLVPLAAAGTELVLVEPFVLPHDGEDRGWVEDLGPRQAAVAGAAERTGAVLVPLQKAMSDAETARTPLTLDGVHPTPAGHRLIADQWWSRWTAAH